jgi:Leucine-rich repeat (LRR) protein
MSDASITGVIPNTIGLFDKMVEFDVSNNKLEGSIPDTICNLTKLKTLDLSKNTLSGPVPPLFLQLNLLTNYKISDNYITSIGPINDNKYYFEEDRYCNNCFAVSYYDVFLCFVREGCPYKKSVTPTRAPTIGGTIGESNTCT